MITRDSPETEILFCEVAMPYSLRLFTAGKDGQRIWDLTSLTSAALGGSLGKAGGVAANHSDVPGQEERQLTLGPDGRPLAVLRGRRAFHRNAARRLFKILKSASRCADSLF
jgi:hypothetical protein